MGQAVQCYAQLPLVAVVGHPTGKTCKHHQNCIFKGRVPALRSCLSLEISLGRAALRPTTNGGTPVARPLAWRGLFTGGTTTPQGTYTGVLPFHLPEGGKGLLAAEGFLIL